MISICENLFFCILERCLRFLGMAQWWKDKKLKQYMKGPCFFWTHSPPTRRMGQAWSLARISVLSENVRRRCSFRERWTGRVDGFWLPFGIYRSSWTAGNQPERFIVAISGEVLARFLKSSVLEQLWGKGNTYYPNWALCFCCKGAERHEHSTEVIVNMDFCVYIFFQKINQETNVILSNHTLLGQIRSNNLNINQLSLNATWVKLSEMDNCSMIIFSRLKAPCFPGVIPHNPRIKDFANVSDSYLVADPCDVPSPRYTGPRFNLHNRNHFPASWHLGRKDLSSSQDLSENNKETFLFCKTCQKCQ